jgi:probable addiction module antidote protein
MPTPHTFDKAKYRDDPGAIAKYLNEALSTDDPVLVRKAIGDVARAQGAAKFSRKVGMAREDLYRGFTGKRTLAFDTVVKILVALDMRLIVKPSRQRTKKPRTMPGL